MIKALSKKLFGDPSNKIVKKMKPIVDKINGLEPEIKKLSDEELSKQSEKFKEMLANGKTTKEILPEAFATVREVALRTLGMRHFDVQLMGGYVLHMGKIAEMKTGEGKTLVATLALYLNGLTGKGAHLVTVNDYLAKRDATWMAPIYMFLGLSVGIIQNESSLKVVWDDKDKFTVKTEECSRKEAYDADITYGTNNEFGFDYLRDNMKFDLADYVQRPLHYAIVDEVDSILIDEARTPLIISGPTEESTDKYYKMDQIIRKLKKDVHYTVDEEHRTAKMNDEGISLVEKELGIDNLYDLKNVDLLHHANNALKAHAIFKKDVDYVVKDGQVQIVDEFTGRLMPGRRYSDGLHQALEAKEGVTIESENQTLAAITFQNYFRMYEKLSGMTGTAVTEAQEFLEIYGLEVVVIPTNMPMIREDYPDAIYKTEKEKFDAICENIVEVHKQGRPVLVGTISIEKSELISKYLKKKGIKHSVLNAKQHEHEAQIVAKAGEAGAVTIATNMAGRGTDIKLGEGVKEAGGLHIIGTERHESRRIDNQLRGRSGRQGDPGSSKFFLSLDDDLLRIFGSEKIAFIMNKLGMKDGEPIEHNMITKAIENAQKKVEGMHFEIRKHLLDYDNIMNQQRNVIYNLRRDILEGTDVERILEESIENVLANLIDTYIENAEEIDPEGLKKEIKNIFDVDVDVTGIGKKGSEPYYEKFLGQIKEKLEEKKAQFDDHFKEFLRFIMINVLDNRWKEHLLNMDHLRDSVGLRGYGQKDPLNEYKREAYELFVEVMERINFETMEIVFHVQVANDEDIALEEKQIETTEERRDYFSEEEKTEKKKPIKRNTPKVGRNDPCPCGSGKKYKKCCGAEQE
jgi:preprotein translocase subunit SecA